jgi:alcohol dehydrogenase (cytochrome c)
MTGAPLIADGVVITGISGAELGTQLFLDGWDPQSGEHLGRRLSRDRKRRTFVRRD